MRSASSRDGAMRRNVKIEYESTLASRCVATSVDAKASWNKINASSRDGTLFVATSVDATEKVTQRNALCSVISQTFRGAGTSVARVRWTARYERASTRGSSFVQRRISIAGAKGQRTASNRYSASSRDGALCKRDRGWGRAFLRFAWALCACALRIPKECPLGVISVRFNNS